MERKLLSAYATARQLGVSVRWLRSEIRAGRIPFLQAGNRKLLDPEAVQDTLRCRARKLPTGEGEGQP